VITPPTTSDENSCKARDLLSLTDSFFVELSYLHPVPEEENGFCSPLAVVGVDTTVCFPFFGHHNQLSSPSFCVLLDLEHGHPGPPTFPSFPLHVTRLAFPNPVISAPPPCHLRYTKDQRRLVSTRPTATPTFSNRGSAVCDSPLR